MTTTSGMLPEELEQLTPEELYALYMGEAGELWTRRAGDRKAAPGPGACTCRRQRPMSRTPAPTQRIIVGPELGFNVHNLHVFTSGRAGGSERYHTHGDALKFYVKGGGQELIGGRALRRRGWRLLPTSPRTSGMARRTRTRSRWCSWLRSSFPGRTARCRRHSFT